MRPGIRGLTALICFLAACSGSEQSVKVPFTVRFGDAPIGCSTPAADRSLTDLRLFVYDFRLINRNGKQVPVRLADRSPWQGGQVALLDFEDGSGSCQNGSREMNTTVDGFVAPGDFSGLAFRIGVPLELNHDDPLQARPPLNISAMHWHWLTGYKFLRAGIAHDDDSFWIHLGSTRCKGVATASSGCDNSNRPRVRLAGFRPGDSMVVLDIGVLAGAVDLDDGVASDCSSGPTESSCDHPFSVLGLDFASGRETGTPEFIRVTKIE